MTEIREPNYSIDLPGDWEQAESLEEGTVVYRDPETMDTLSVTLLAAAQSFAIADPKMLLEQYLHHRSQFEGGKSETLQQTDRRAWMVGDSAEGAWEAVDPETDRRVAHRVILTGLLLADFRYTAFGMSEQAFEEKASAILESASATA